MPASLLKTGSTNMKKFFTVLLYLFLAVLSFGVLLAVFLIVSEYRPADVEPLSVTGISEERNIPLEKPVELISWNVGFAALGKDADFVMDGGGSVPRANKAQVEANLSGIRNTLEKENTAEIWLLQETDSDSARSYHKDFRNTFALAQNTYALNYSCPFVPYPWPPFGKINSGLLTASSYDVETAERISLPCPFSWPMRTANLKRCLLVSYLPVEGSDRKLVLINLHLEAYDDGEGNLAQMQQLLEFMQSEYEKGNYVIAAGDFNQLFPGTEELYPNHKQDLWMPVILEEDSIPEGFFFAFDASVPTCRLLNQPYNPSDTANTQYYVIDGMIASPNIRLNSVETLDEAFVYSDHNPVSFSVTLLAE